MGQSLTELEPATDNVSLGAGASHWTVSHVDGASHHRAVSLMELDLIMG